MHHIVDWYGGIKALHHRLVASATAVPNAAAMPGSTCSRHRSFKSYYLFLGELIDSHTETLT